MNPEHIKANTHAMLMALPHADNALEVATAIGFLVGSVGMACGDPAVIVGTVKRIAEGVISGELLNEEQGT